MNQNLIISENNPEEVNMFLGSDLYLIEEKMWYDELVSEGGNKYRFLNIVSHGGEEVIPKGQRDFFFKMINAIQTDRIKMDADGFAVVNAFNYKGLKWENLEQKFSPKFCVFWGVDPHKMDVQCQLNGVALHNGCRIIYVHSMDIIQDNNEMKKQLWELIKRMFDMNKK